MITPGCLRKSETPTVLPAGALTVNQGIHEPEQLALEKIQKDLGEEWEIMTFIPGRFANAIQKKSTTRHALQIIREDMTSSFILNLQPDGTATVCRGWRYLLFNDGPLVQTNEHIREQLGYRGFWEYTDDWVSLNLKLDDSVCTRIGEYSQYVPNHSSEWQLHCLPIMPKGHSNLTVPVLVCLLTNVESEFGENEPHIATDILPGRWIVLGSDNGLRIKIDTNSISDSEAPVVRVAYSADPVEVNSWMHSF